MGLTRYSGLPLPPGHSEVGNALMPRPEIYVVLYKLSWSEDQYEAFISELKNSLYWFNYMPGAWFVVRRETLVDLAAILRKRIVAADWLLVLPARGPGDGILPVAAWEWLNEKLPKLWGA